MASASAFSKDVMAKSIVLTKLVSAGKDLGPHLVDQTVWHERHISDEIGCEILTVDESYLKEVPPGGNGSLKVQVKAAVDVLSILEIVEVDNSISFQLGLKLTWVDNRLVLLNLKDDKDINTLTMDFRNKIWIPEVVFSNTQSKMESLNDEKAFVTIERRGEFRLSPRDQLYNSLIFQGSENPISISRVYDSPFLCIFDVSTYC